METLTRQVVPVLCTQTLVDCLLQPLYALPGSRRRTWRRCVETPTGTNLDTFSNIAVTADIAVFFFLLRCLEDFFFFFFKVPFDSNYVLP